ncbi:MAG: putative ATP-dependent endonuclease of the family [Thermoanaerobacterium sp.]|nr:putative ATP-dependent endonuclease of the family [Thermoanaerobacterium sp.]
MAALNIFSRILDLYRSKSIPFEESLFTTRKGEKILPLVLAIDEPEVHLHPYMQRAILNYYKCILKNEDENFIELLKYSFNIDGLDGQLIVVTHSTDVLVDNHRNIVRFYKTKDKRTNAISGMDINIKPDVEKHLIMNFQDIKEAFYSKCVLIVEGETEYGCIRGFAKTLNIPMDDYGICFVNAQGEGSIPKLQQLFNHFAIPSIVIFDSDVKEGKTASENEFFTKEICFEMDIVDKLIEMGKFDTLKSIALELDDDANVHILDADFVKKPFKKIGYDLATYTPKSLEELNIDQINEYRAVYFAWYYNKKGILIGRIIGNTLPADCIPICYINAINKAKEVALL